MRPVTGTLNCTLHPHKHTDSLTHCTTMCRYTQHAWNTTVCGGGVFWGPVTGTPSYKNSITNELSLRLAAVLHVATGDDMCVNPARTHVFHVEC
jgi:hypothetical protein